MSGPEIAIKLFEVSVVAALFYAHMKMVGDKLESLTKAVYRVNGFNPRNELPREKAEE